MRRAGLAAAWGAIAALGAADAWAAGATANLTLAGFGELSALIGKRNPWHGFRTLDPVLLSIRAQRVEDASCPAWITAFSATKDGAPLGRGSGAQAESLTEPLAEPLAGWAEAARQWEPWSKREREEIADCEDLPCDVKLDGKEVERMKAAPEQARLSTYLKLVAERVGRYAATQERKEYEFPGDPKDPWDLFEKEGYRTALVRPARPQLWVRRLEFAAKGEESTKAKPLHQVLDRRLVVTEDRKEAVAWTRDAYTDHFFDGWGEWERVTCGADGSVTVVQVVLVEFDLLKKGDLVSRIMRGKMRTGVEEQTRAYLNRRFAALQDASLAGAKKAPAVPGLPKSDPGTAGTP